MDVRFVERLAVDVDLLGSELERLAGEPDDALDEVAVRLVRVLEDDDVATPDVAHGQQLACNRAGRRAEDELVHQQVIADEQVVLHRAGRDLERLDDPRTHEQCEDHRDHD